MNDFRSEKEKVGNEIKFLEFLFNHEKGNERKKDENIFVYFKLSFIPAIQISSLGYVFNKEILQ